MSNLNNPNSAGGVHYNPLTESKQSILDTFKPKAFMAVPDRDSCKLFQTKTEYVLHTPTVIFTFAKADNKSLDLVDYKERFDYFYALTVNILLTNSLKLKALPRDDAFKWKLHQLDAEKQRVATQLHFDLAQGPDRSVRHIASRSEIATQAQETRQSVKSDNPCSSCVFDCVSPDNADHCQFCSIDFDNYQPKPNGES